MQTVEPDAQPISQLWRYTLHPGSGLVEDRQLFPRALEYPSVNPDYTGGAGLPILHTSLPPACNILSPAGSPPPTPQSA